MFIVKIEGGLGNQLFQLCFSKWLKAKTTKDIKLELASMWFYDLHPMLLHEYSIVKFKKPKLLELLPKKIKRFLGLIFKYIRKLQFSNQYIQENEAEFQFTKDFLNAPKGYYEGYFQDLKFCEPFRSELKQSLIPQEPLSQDDKRLRKRMLESHYSVCVHVRRGDYVNNPKINKVHGTCKWKYYQEALELIARKYNLSNFKELDLYIFSDDIDWVKKEMYFPKSSVFVSKRNRDDVIEHYLMRGCNNHIIANSTFSWWSSFLSDNDNFVVYPRLWFSNKKSRPNIFLSNWFSV